MALLPGGIPTSEGHGAPKAKGCIRSWKPWTWRTRMGVISGAGNIASLEGIGAAELQALVGWIVNAGNIASAAAYGSATVHNADEIWAASPSLADVQAAIALASPGDTVRVPAGDGSETWASNLLVTKGILLIGPGEDYLTITGTYTTGISNSYIEGYQIGYKPTTPSDDPPFRFSGFKVIFGEGSAGFGIFNDDSTKPLTKIRIDHCDLSKPGGGGGDMIISQGHVYGVVDNCDLTGGYFMFRALGNDGASWTNQTFTLGTGNNLYYEDNVIHCTYDSCITEGGSGGRYAFRYNDITFDKLGGLQMFDAHGNTSASHSSTMGVEIYENILRGPNSDSGGQLLDHRGGRCVAFNNTYVGPNPFFQLNPREEALDSDGPGPAFSPDGQPQHVSGSYYFNNKSGTTLGGATVITIDKYVLNGQVNYGGLIGLVPQWNIDCWRHTTPFTGASGVGVGLLSARPATCTVGVGYWATDESKLYRCSATNVWTLYYTPYAYPHPHRSDPVLGD